MKKHTPILLLALLAPTPAQAADVTLEGWTLAAPAGWRARAEGGRVLLGHDTEAGMLVAWTDASATEATLRAAGAEGIDEDGFSLRPTGAVRSYSKTKYSALAVDLAGKGPDGTALRGRIIGILAPKGGAVALLALTSDEAFDQLAKRLDALAGSARVSAAPAAASGTAQLAGALCTYSGNSEVGRTQRVTFDGRGGVTYGSETTGSGSFSNGGGWGMSSGNQYDATSRGRYEVRGEDVTVQIGGDTMRCRVHFRQRDGRITEVKCGDRLWGTSLCD